MMRDDDVDEFINVLNKRKGSDASADSINLRESAHDPMNKTRRGRDEGGLSLIQPISLDPRLELGKNLGQMT